MWFVFQLAKYNTDHNSSVVVKEDSRASVTYGAVTCVFDIYRNRATDCTESLRLTMNIRSNSNFMVTIRIRQGIKLCFSYVDDNVTRKCEKMLIR